MSAVKQLESLVSIAEYLEIEQQTDLRHEYHDGQIYAMAGGTSNHMILCTTINGLLFTRLENNKLKCKAYNSEAKVAIDSQNRYLYPDATVVCGDIIWSSKVKAAITNPILIVEVLSESSADYDRNDKFEFYKAIQTLQEYVLIEQDKPEVIVYYRKPNSSLWKPKTFTDLKTKIDLKSLNIAIDMSELYFNLTFEKS